MEAAAWPLESHRLPFSPFIFTWKCSLVRLKVSGFCYTTNTGLSLGLLLDILLLSCVMEILQFWICRVGPSHAPKVNRFGGCWSGLVHSPGSGHGW